MIRLLFVVSVLLGVAAVGTVLVITARAVWLRQTRMARVNDQRAALELEAAEKQQDWTLADIERHRQRLNANLDKLEADLRDGGNRL